jgi:hypothetical protein
MNWSKIECLIQIKGPSFSLSQFNINDIQRFENKTHFFSWNFDFLLRPALLEFLHTACFSRGFFSNTLPRTSL